MIARLALRRAYYRLRTQLKGESPLFSVLDHCWRKTPVAWRCQWQHQPLLVIDGEMSALDVEAGHLLSLGWVRIVQGAIVLDSAEHHYLLTEDSVGQSASIHHIRDCDLDAGQSQQAIITRLLELAAGHVLVFHHARLDLAYLNRACLQLYGAPLLMPYVDTLQLEQRRLQRREQLLPAAGLRLDACRARYNLPAYPSHDALTDALATAELLLAQLAHSGDPWLRL